MLDPARITLVVLAGGLATRLPGKLALPVAGEPLLERVVRRLRAPGMRCVLSVRDAAGEDMALRMGCDAARDEFEGAGPLAGLAAAARLVRTPLLFAAAGDMAGLERAFVERLARRFDAAETDALVPRWPDGKVEPLAALYATVAIARGARAALAAGRRKVTAALQGLRVAYEPLTDADIDMLANVNTAGDYDALSASRTSY